MTGLFLLHPPAWSQSLCLRTGIYDFTSDDAREFYKAAGMITAGVNVWNRDRIHLCVSSGLGFNAVRYNDHRHYLYLIPVYADMNFDLANPGSKVVPRLGLGMILFGKIDQNVDLEKTYLALTYGYRAAGGMKIRLIENLHLTIDISYNLVLPPESEEINISGVMTLVGIEIPLSKNETKRKTKTRNP